jgi:hypothetical protein
VARLLDVVTRDHIATTIELEPLKREDIEEMVEAMWERVPSAEDLAALEKLGEGVPFFIEELAAARAVGHRDVPATIARAVGARLDRLDERARGVVVAASLMTGALDPAVLAIVSGIAEREIPAHLIAAARAGLLTDDEGHLVFRHALVRESIASSILSVERRELHEKLARALEQRYAQDLDAHAAALARHWSDAGDEAKAAEWWVKAGERALDAGALDEASEAFKNASSEHAAEEVRLRALMGQGVLAMRTHAFHDAKALFRKVADSYIARDERLPAARALFELARLTISEFDRAGLSVLDEAIALLDLDEPFSRRLKVEKGLHLIRSFHEIDDAEPLLLAVLTTTSDSAEADTWALAHQGLAWLAEGKGDLDLVNDHMSRAIGVVDRLQNLDTVTSVASDRALFGAQQGRTSEATEIIQTWRDRFAERLMSSRVALLDHMLVWLLWRRGTPAAAEQVALRLETTRWALLWGRVVRVWAAAERGDESLGRSILDSWWKDLGDPAHRLHAMLNPSESSLSEGYAAVAELVYGAFAEAPVSDECLASARAQVRAGISVLDVDALTFTLAARVMLRAGDNEGATEAIKQLEPLLIDRPYPWHLGAVAEIKGGMKDGPELAATAFEEAASHFAGAANLSDRARCLRLLAKATALPEKRIELLREGRSLALEAGALAELNRTDALLRDAGVRPRAGRPKGSRRSQGELSAREQEVAVLVAGGPRTPR